MEFERDEEFRPLKIVLQTQAEFDAFEGLIDSVNDNNDFLSTVPEAEKSMAIVLSNKLGDL